MEHIANVIQIIAQDLVELFVIHTAPVNATSVFAMTDGVELVANVPLPLTNASIQMLMETPLKCAVETAIVCAISVSVTAIKTVVASIEGCIVKMLHQLHAVSIRIV